ncbi:MAG: hypothetical protein N3E42_02030 [Candidatus Bipolaricaulota bacterium]|nr:hypothetical protein [Candidatus Bipolaricaulota bacterium]
MKSEILSWRQLTGRSLLAASLLLSVVLLGLTERNYAAFRETLRHIQFEIRLVEFQQIESQRALLRWHARASGPAPKVPSSLELLDWHLRSADGSVYLGFYTTSEIEVALAPGVEIPLEAVVEGNNFAKLRRLREESPGGAVPLRFDGAARVVFRAPRGKVSKIIPVVGVFTLGAMGER